MGTKTDKLVEQLADTHKRLRDSSSRSGMSAQDRALLERQIAKLEGSVADLTAQHVACAEEEAIRTGAFLPTDSQKELAFADAESLMSPPAHIQTQREDGCSSRASSLVTVVSRQHLGSRFSHSDAGEGSQASSRSRGSQDANP
jgi:hypothetical protein